ncbi:hypothetical protein DSO57_1020856 [Entomophthora muscae]|uniref:Uncharacterized protein n=1 Tax=Entomophthora muscae TaxID=34485 RepID=A0ACC2UP09_9FUNG|nr:hypothetical protein DSO57_1020856 [Entomophthora muscae]
MSFVLSSLGKAINTFRTLFSSPSSSFHANCFYCNSNLFFYGFDYGTGKPFDPCSYTCSKCDSLNVRDSNGDIVDHVPEMFEEKPASSLGLRISRPQYSYSKSEVPYCEACITNRESNLKVLSDYSPWRCYPEFGVGRVSATEFKALVDAKYPLSCKICSIRNQKLLRNIREKALDFYERTIHLFNSKKKEPRTRYYSELTKTQLLVRNCLHFVISLNFWIWNFFFLGLILYGYFMYRDVDLLLAQFSKLTWERIDNYFAYDKDSDTLNPSYKVLLALFALNNTLLYCPTALNALRFSPDILGEIRALRDKFYSRWFSLWRHRFAHIFFVVSFLHAEEYYGVSLLLKEATPLNWPYSIPSLILMLDLTWLLVIELMFIRVYFTLIDEAKEIVDLNLPDKLMTRKVCSLITSLEEQSNESQPMEVLTALFSGFTLNDQYT